MMNNNNNYTTLHLPEKSVLVVATLHTLQSPVQLQNKQQHADIGGAVPPYQECVGAVTTRMRMMSWSLE